MKRKISGVFGLLFLCLFFVGTVYAATMGLYPVFRAETTAGLPLNGGRLYTYEPGSAVSKQVYQNRGLTTAHTNPVVLNSRGEATIYLNGAYKLILKDSSDTTIWTVDNYQGDGVTYQTGVSNTFCIFGPSGTSEIRSLDRISGASLQPGTFTSDMVDLDTGAIRTGASAWIGSHVSGNSITSSMLQTVVVHNSTGSSIYGLLPISGSTSTWITFVEGAGAGGITIYPSSTDNEPFHGDGLSGVSHLSLPRGNPWKRVELYSIIESGTCKYWYIMDADSGWVSE